MALVVADDGCGFDLTGRPAGAGWASSAWKSGSAWSTDRSRSTPARSAARRIRSWCRSAKNRMPRPTVLLADDHPVVAEELAALLRDEFTLVGTVADGAGLLEAARRLETDVIVTDVTMPGLTGLDALRRIRKTA